MLRFPKEINFGWAVFKIKYLEGPLYAKEDETEQVYGDVCFDETQREPTFGAI